MTETPFELDLAGSDDPRRFRAFVPGDGGQPLAEHHFEWRIDSTQLALELGELARAAIAGLPPQDDLHHRFGRCLFDTVMAGPVGELWRQRRQATGRQPLPLVIRADPATARPLLNLPWEYLHDGQDFLALNWRTPISRLPWGLPTAQPQPPLAEPLRLLVFIAAPHGLDQNQVLNTAREEDLILAALAGARQAGEVDIQFSPNGSLEALEAGLRQFDPHALHFVGHGVFVEEKDTGLLLLESATGAQRPVANAEFAELLGRRARSLRFVFLSACQSAVAPRTEGYADLAPRLLQAGLAGVVAMQYSVLNRSAMDFGQAFYQGLAGGDPLDAALTEARGRLARTGLNTVDFATPVLFLADPGCLRVDKAALAAPASRTPLDLTGAAAAQRFAGRQAELHMLQTRLDPEDGPWRAAIIYGLGGMGKTVLAARLAERMAARFDGVKAIRMSPTSTAQAVLEQVAGFLMVHQHHLDCPAIGPFLHVHDRPLPLESKAGALAEVLRQRRLLLILDNYEDVLPEGQRVSRAAQAKAEAAAGQTGLDPDLARLVALLLGSVAGPSRFLFTSRVDFEPLEAGRQAGAIGHLPLAEMGFREAVYLMETLPPLDGLPVAVLPETRPDGPPRPEALTQRQVYERLGGHPYTLALFSEHARRSSVEAVLARLEGVERELLEFTLLAEAATALPERAAELLRRAAIYDEPVPLAGLAFLLGDETDVMPDVTAEVERLLGWGLLARPDPAEPQVYAVPALVRGWARAGYSPGQRQAWLERAGRFWYARGRETGNLGDYLRARHYRYLAGDYEGADDIVQTAVPYLHRWGQIELLLELLQESARCLEGRRQAIALGNLATVYQGLGHYPAAREAYEQVLAGFRAAGDRRNEAAALHQLGMLHQHQGEYEPARQRYEQSLAIKQELGDRAGIASSLYQLGNLHYLQGEYEPARQRVEQSLVIAQELGHRAGMARLLHQLGMLHQAQREYGLARQRYEQSLAILQELGDRAGIASSLHQLGILHQMQGEYEPARQRTEQSLAIFQELGDRAGIANSLGQLGNLHYLQGETEPARQRYEQSLAIFQELGDRAGIAKSLHQLGMLHQMQGEYGPARQRYEQSLAILQELGNRAGIASSLHQLGMLHQMQGEYGPARQRYEQSLAIAQELGDRDGIARSLGQLGMLFEEEGAYGPAVKYAARAFVIFQQLGSPDREITGQTLARLRDKMGQAAFEAALAEAGAAGLPVPEEAPAGEMTIDKLVEQAVHNTLAVLTAVPDRKEEWWQDLGDLAGQARAQEQAGLAAFLELLRQVVEGAAPAGLASQVPPPFQAAWAELVGKLGQG